MKKAFFGIFALFAISAGLFAQQQPVVAVAPFDAISGISATDANMITRVFFIRLGNTSKVSLVDRSVVERVLREHSFQAGDWSNQQKTAELGSALNANWIVRGEIEKFSTNILITVQFYDIQTFRFMGGSDLRLANADEAYDKMDPLVDKLIETVMVATNYKIGDRGPGGGIIFFAENGRYMECSGELGSANWDVAKNLARNHKGGGFSNWYLPNSDELTLIHRNLGGRVVGQYWSTSTHEMVTLNLGLLYDFDRGMPVGDRKTQNYSVCAIRTF